MNKSWIKIKTFMPFRSKYFYWDKPSCISKYEFIKSKVRIKFLYKINYPNAPYKGFIISCWRKDEKKVEDILDNLNKKIIFIDKNYNDFLRNWRS